MADKFTRDWYTKRHKGVRMGTLWCSSSDVDGDITLSPQFLALTPLERLDILGDYIGLLTREYQATQKEFNIDWEHARTEAILERSRKA